jgi:hypothetical protein
VRAVTADQMSAALAQASREATATVIGAAIPEDTGQQDNWPACASLLPHVQAAVLPDSEATAQMADYLASIGNYIAARDLAQKVAAARERTFGRDDRRTLEAQGDLANWTGMAGEGSGPRDQQARLLRIQQRLLDPEDFLTVTTRANLAHWTGEAGDAAGVIRECAALLPILEQVSALRIPIPSPSPPTLRTGPGTRGMRLPLATGSPNSCQCVYG